MESAGITQKRTVLSYVRNAVATPLAGVATFLYVTWQLVVEQQLFLRTFLVERMGKPGIAKLPLGYGNVLALKTILLLHICLTILRVARCAQADGAANAAPVARREVSRNQVLAITEYQAGEIEPRQFYSEHVKRGVPCILRGFVKNASDGLDTVEAGGTFP